MTSPSVGRRAAVSLSSQLVAKLLHLVLNVVSTVAIMRYLAPDAYGTYALVLLITTLAGVVADFGLPKLATREMVRHDRDPDAVAGTVIAMRLVLAALAVVGSVVAVHLFDGSAQARTAALVASGSIVVEALTSIVVLVFHVRVVQQYEAVTRVVAEFVDTALVLVFIALGASVAVLFAAPVIGGLVGLVLAARLARTRFGFRPTFDRSLVPWLVREALPLGPALMIATLYLKLDSLVVAWQLPRRDLGLYSAAYQPIEYLLLASAVVVNVLFPLLAGHWVGGRGRQFAALYRSGAEVLVAAGLLVVIVTVAVGEQVVVFVLGRAYAEATAPLAVLSVALVAMCVNVWQSMVLLAGGHQRVTLVYNLAALVVSLVASVILVAEFGIVGAATAALLTAGLVLVASTIAVRVQMATELPIGHLGALVGLAVVVAAALQGLDALGLVWPLVVVLGVVAFGAAAWRLGTFARLKEALQ